MSSDETPFTDEYNTTPTTAPPASREDSGYEQKLTETETEIEEQLYPSGKPRRIRIRARITRD
jgi:hypothetical protein